MSLTSIFSNGLAGLSTSQAALRVVSQNIANVNTPGYARSETLQQARVYGASGSGVEITGFRRAVDEFLSRASISAIGAQGAADAKSDLLERAQAVFGDPNSPDSLFASLNSVFANLTTLSASPTNGLARSSTVAALQTFLSQMSSAATQVENLRIEAEQMISAQAQTASGLMSRIADLNTQIRVIRSSGGDATGAENVQAQLIDELSSFIDIRVTGQDNGGVEIRTGAGALLVSDRAAAISYTTQSVPYGPTGRLDLLEPSGVTTPLEGLIRGGSIQGLLSARSGDLKQLADSLGAMTAVFADQINAIHNLNSSVPPPSSLTGRNTGMVDTDPTGMTGRATINVVNSTGTLSRTVLVDFSAGTYSVNGAAAVSFGGPGATMAQLVSGLDTALVGLADVNFANGVLSMTASSASSGLIVQQDAATPSANGGRSFSHFFGLNDLITRAQPMQFFPGFTSPLHQLTGGAMTFRVTDSTGRVMLERSVNATGTTWADMVTALNDSSTGLPSTYGAFSFSTGRMSLASAPGYTVEVIGDTTQRGDTGLSVSALFGLDRYATAARATDMRINPVIVADSRKLALARPDLSAGLGAIVTEAGDTTGANDLLNLSSKSIVFNAFGIMGTQTTTLSAYLSNIGGEIGRRADDVQNQAEAAASVSQLAAERRSSVEGVNLDDELVKMTTYQQSYAAASRVIQAAKDMFDILLNIK